MWKGKGRSGYGESSTLGDYDDWSCLSRNGKQWKNPITMETRDLSGADYWHMRKQLTDSYDVPEELHAVNETVSLAHTLPNGKANLLAYADRPVKSKPISKVSIKDKILPQKRRVDSLTSQMVELESEYKAGKISIADYSLYRDIVSVKRDRAIVLLDRASKVKPIRPEYLEDSAFSYAETFDNSSDNTQEGSDDKSSWVDEISDKNSLKRPLKIACTVVKALVRFTSATKHYIKTLQEV